MRNYPGVPEMLEQVMQESGDGECWVTVHEIRKRFRLTRYQCTTIAGFLRRLEYGPFRSCPYIVVRIERPCTPADNRACRYLVTRIKDHVIPVQGQNSSRPRSEQSPVPGI